MNILILGGTGTMGSFLVSSLANNGNKCVVTSRKERKSSHNISYIKGNAHDIQFISSVLSRSWDVVIDFMDYSTEEFRKRIDLFLNNTEQYIYISSARVYADSANPLTEDSPLLIDVCEDTEYLKTDEYALRKSRQEKLLKQSGRSNWTIIRPYVTFSNQQLQLSSLQKEDWLYRAITGRTIIFSKDLAEKKTTFTYGEDVANGICSVVGKKGSLGEVYNITNDESLTWGEIFSIYIKAIEIKTHKSPKVLWLEGWQSFMGGDEAQVKWDRLYNRIINSGKINQFIDTSAFHSLEDSLKKCIFEIIEKQDFKTINWVKEAKRDKLTKEWANVIYIPGVKNRIRYILERLSLYKYFQIMKL